MPSKKQFTVKVYDQGGSFIRSFSSDRPADESLPYLKNTPEFPCKINGGFGECVLDFAYPFDDFDEGNSIDFMNIVKIYSVKTVDATQTIDLIYSGFMSKYDPYIEPGAEGVRVTCLGLISLTSASYYKNGASFEVTHSGEDPETIGRAIIDHFNTIYSGGLLSYDGSTTDPVGTNVSLAFTDQRWNEALAKTGEQAGEGWWWKIDEEGKYWLKAKPTTPTHTFTIGKDIERLHGEKDGEKALNDIFVRRSGGTETNYTDATSQEQFGTGSPATGKRSTIITDSALTDAYAADQRGNKELEDNKNPKVRSPLTVNANYPLETIKVGETCKITNLKNGNTFFGDNLLIVGLTYHGDTVDIELEEASGSFGAELSRFVQSNATQVVNNGGSSGGGGSSGFVDREVPSGSINDTNRSFTISQIPVSGSEHVYLNGVLQNSGVDYSISGADITFVVAPETGGTILVSYRTSNGSTNFVDRETPSGTVNGSNNTFSIAHTPTTGSEYVWLNGILQNSGVDYSLSGTTITFTVPPDSGSIILISYRY